MRSPHTVFLVRATRILVKQIQKNKNSGGLNFGTPHYGIPSSFPGGYRGHYLLDWYERSIKRIGPTGRWCLLRN